MKYSYGKFKVLECFQETIQTKYKEFFKELGSLVYDILNISKH